MFSFLQGYKTYLIAALAAAVQLLHVMGYIDEHTKTQLLTLLGTGAVATVAAKINRINQDKGDDKQW